jgi:hypothetical protein
MLLWFTFVFFAFLFSPHCSCLGSSICGYFDLFFFIWDGLGCELILFTKGFHLIPHKFIDWDDSSFGEENRCFSHSSNFPLIGFKLDDDLLGVAQPLPCDPLVQIWGQLVLIWSQIGWFGVLDDFWDCWNATHRQFGTQPRIVRPSGSSSACLFLHSV